MGDDINEWLNRYRDDLPESVFKNIESGWELEMGQNRRVEALNDALEKALNEVPGVGGILAYRAAATIWASYYGTPGVGRLTFSEVLENEALIKQFVTARPADTDLSYRVQYKAIRNLREWWYMQKAKDRGDGGAVL